jgi:hypothetical protein
MTKPTTVPGALTRRGGSTSCGKSKTAGTASRPIRPAKHRPNTFTGALFTCPMTS